MKPIFIGKSIHIIPALFLLAGLTGGSVSPPVLYAGDEELLGVEEEVQSEEYREKSQKKMEETFLGPGQYAVSGAKHAQRLSESPSAITVLTRDDIKAYGVTTVEELLRVVPGVLVKDISPSFKIVGLRGFHSNMGNSVLVLVDGQEVNFNLFGGIIWSLFPVSLDDVERIEVIRGPGSSLYGANAFSGVINITTRTPRELKTVQVISEAGAYDRELGTLFFKGKFARRFSPFSLQASVDFDRKQSWMVPEQTITQLYRTRAKAIYEPSGDTQATLEAGYLEGNQKYFANLAEMDFHYNSIFYTSANVHWKDLKFVGNYRRVNFAAQDISPIYFLQLLLPEIKGYMDNLEGRVEYSQRLPFRNRLTVGGGYLMNIFDTNILVKEYNTEKRLGLFLQDEWRAVENLLLTLGLRYDYNSVTDPSFSPRASAVYSLNRDHNLRASFGWAFRKPSFFEYGLKLKTLENSGIDMLYNYDLRNAKVRTYEIGYQGNFLRRFRIDVAGYYSQYRDMIIGSLSEVRFENFKNYADGAGGEIAVEAFILPWLNGFANYSYLKTIYLISQKDAHFPLIDDFYAPHIFNLGVRAEPWKGLRLSSTLNWVSRSHETITDPDRSSGLPHDSGRIAIGPNWVLNFRGSYLFFQERLEAGVKAFNLLDGNKRQFPGLIWNRVAPEVSRNWGGEEVGRTILGFVEASF